MSRIYFHNPVLDKPLELYGSERAYMARIIDDISLALLMPKTNRDRIKKHIAESSYSNDYQDEMFDRYFNVWFHASDENFINPNMDKFEIALNTAYKFGNDQIKLAARLHGQCEIFCYIHPDKIPWFSRIIRDGLKLGIYRTNQGWETIESFIYPGNHYTVCSYSVCDSFPNREMSGYNPDDDSYYDLPYEDQWGMSIDNLLKNKWLEITPDNWEDYYFGENKTVFDLLRD